MNQTTNSDTRKQDPTPASSGGGEPNDPAEGARDDTSSEVNPDKASPEEHDPEEHDPEEHDPEEHDMGKKVPSTHVPDTRSFDL